jgi:hypothetical protein
VKDNAVLYDPVKGTVRVWHIEDEKWIWMKSVDARDALTFKMIACFNPDEDPPDFSPGEEIRYLLPLNPPLPRGK